MKIENNILIEVDDEDIINGTFDIPDNVTEIKNHAFWVRTSLESITIPDSVITIGFAAFADCTGLKTLKIYNSETEIKNRVFAGCKNLKNVSVPDNIKINTDKLPYYCYDCFNCFD